MTEVVFGANAWEFRRSRVAEHGAGTPVLFYESWGPKLPQASWDATFCRVRRVKQRLSAEGLGVGIETRTAPFAVLR